MAWALGAVGIAAGMLSGLFGVGGGVIMVPALVLLIALPQKTAQGMSLAVMVPMALFGAWRYWQQPNIGMNMGVVALLAIGALVGTLAGTEIAVRLPEHVLRRSFAVFLIIVAIRMLLIPDAKPPSARAAPVRGPEAARTP